MVFVTHMNDKWLLLHQYLPKNIIFLCSSVYECYSGLEIIFIISPNHVAQFSLAVTHEYTLKIIVVYDF